MQKMCTYFILVYVFICTCLIIQLHVYTIIVGSALLYNMSCTVEAWASVCTWLCENGSLVCKLVTFGEDMIQYINVLNVFSRVNSYALPL